MRLLLAAVLALAAAGPARAQGGEASGSARWDARLTAFTGAVAVHPGDGSDPVEAQEDMPLEEGDRVTTEAGATAEISLDGESLIALAENSDFKIEKADKAESVFALTLGSLLAKIQHLGDRRLSVRSPSSVAAVRGTEFGVDVEGESSHVGVFDEGRVEVKGGSGGTEVLTPNQETSVRGGQAPQKARPLQRFLARRQMMKARIDRLQAVRRRWQAMPPSARKRRRLRALKRRIRAVQRRKRAVNRQLRRRNQRGAAPDKNSNAPEKRP